MKTILKNKKNYALIILSFLIPSIAVLIGLIAGSFAPFGVKNILSASGYDDYLPYYYELYDKIHEGKGLGYSIDSGLGYDFISLIAYYISDPLNFVILLFPRESIISIIDIVYLVKIGLAGSSMSLFLMSKKVLNNNKNNILATSEEANKQDDKKNNFVIGFKTIPNSNIIRFIMTFDWVILAFSVAYALSITMIGIGMNISFTGAISIFPIIMLGVEKIKNENNSKLLIISLTISIFSNLHISIITTIFLIIYLITRDFDDLTVAFHSICKTLFSIVCCILCSSLIIVYSIIGGFFTDCNSLYFPAISFDNPMNCFRQLMSQSIPSYTSMYGAYDVAICIFSVFLLICYILQSKIKTTTKLKNLGILFFLLSGTCVSTTRFLFNGFNLDACKSIHYSYIICFLFLLIAFDELEYIHKLGSIKTIFAFILSGIIIFSGMFFSNSYDNSGVFIKTLEYLFCYFLLLIIFTSKSMTKTLFQFTISVIIILEVLIPFVTNISNVGNFYLSQKLENIYSIQLYEVAKQIHSYDNDVRILIYNPNNSNETPLTSDLSGYDYIISHTSSSPYGYIEPQELYSSEDSVLKIRIFKPDSTIKHALLPQNITEYYYNPQNPFSSSNQLSTLLFERDKIFDLIDVNVEPSMSTDGSSASFAVSFDNISAGHVYFNAYYTVHLCDAAQINQGFSMQDIPRSNNLNIQYAYNGAVLNEKNYNDLLNTISQNTKINQNNDHSFDAICNTSGYISTGYQNIKSLSFYVNDTKVKPISIINNNALVPVIAGKNNIEIKYSYTGIILSLFITIIGVVLSILINKYNLKKQPSNNKILTAIQDNYVYFISPICVGLVFMLCQMITSSMPFGVYAIIKDDGISQYFAWFTDYIQTIKNSNMFSPVSFSGGGFEDIYRNVIANNFHFSYGFIPYLLTPNRFHIYLFSLYYILYLLSPTASIIFYFTHRNDQRYDKHDKRLIIYALLYALSSYVSVFFQYYVAFRLAVYLPLIILSFEQLIYSKKCTFYVCMLTIMMFDVYTCFLVCEFLLLYFFTMNFKNFKDFIYKGIRFVFCSIISALLSSFNLIPFYYTTRQSRYITSDNRTPSLFHQFVSFFKQIAEYHTGNTLKTISDNDAQTASYCGLIMLYVMVLYIINKNISITTRIKKVLLLIILFIATNNEMLNYILHGFHFQTLVPNRFAFFIILLLITMLGDVNLGSYSYSKKELALSVIPITIIMTFIYIKEYGYPSITLKISIALLIIYLITTIYNLLTKDNKQHYLLYIAVFDILINAVIVFPFNIGSKSDLTTVAATFNSIADHNPEMTSFETNTEYIINSSAYKNIGKLTNLHTLSFFDSAFTKDTMDYISFYNIATGSNSITYKSNPLADMMLRIKYHITNEYDDESISIYPKVYQKNEFILHKNPNNIGLGFIRSNSIDSNISIDNIQKSSYKNSFEYQNAIVNYLGGEDIYTTLDCPSQYSPMRIYYTLDEIYTSSDLHSKGVSYAPITIHFPKSFEGEIYLDELGCIKLLGVIDENHHELSFDFPVNRNIDLQYFKPCIAVYNKEAMASLNNIIQNNLLTNTTNKRSSIDTELNTTDDGMLFISLPYYEGWDIYVDNEKVEKKHYLGGIGINISKGNHKIHMKYHSPYSLLGIIISLTTLIILAVLNIIRLQRKRNNH